MQQRRDSVRGKVEDLLTIGQEFPNNKRTGALCATTIYDDGTGPYLLHYPLDPDLERLERRAAQFKASSVASRR